MIFQGKLAEKASDISELDVISREHEHFNLFYTELFDDVKGVLNNIKREEG